LLTSGKTLARGRRVGVAVLRLEVVPGPVIATVSRD
jgi:hypothetical protein